MQVWNVLHAACWKYGTQKIAKNSLSAHHHTALPGYILATKAHIDKRKKNLASSNIYSRCPHNMVNFSPLTAEIGPVVWCTPANFNGFRILAALLHGTPAVGVSRNCGIEQRAPPIFGRAAITLGIGPTSSFGYYLWPPWRSRCIHCILVLFLLVSFISSPNLSGRRLDVYHTSTHGVALVRIWNAGLKCAARGSLEVWDPKKLPKIRHLGTIAQLCLAMCLQLRYVLTIGKKAC